MSDELVREQRVKRLKATVHFPDQVWLVLEGHEDSLPKGARLLYMRGDSIPGARLIVDGVDRGEVVAIRPTSVESFSFGGERAHHVEETEIDCYLDLSP